MNSFAVKLPENRKTLESVPFPDGSVRPVQYMRGGVILFADKGPGATYERSDNGVVITPLESSEAANVAKAYLGRVRR